MRSISLIVILLAGIHASAQTSIPLAFKSEEDNRLLREDDSFKYYVATGDTSNIAGIDEEAQNYRLLNRDQVVIAEGCFSLHNDKYLREGRWVQYFASGKEKTCGYYVSDKQAGLWQENYNTGKKKKLYTYALIASDEGMVSCLSGGYQEFYPDGKLKINGYYAAVTSTEHDTLAVDDPVTGATVVKVLNRNTYTSRKTGHWEYYSESGELEKKEDL